MTTVDEARAALIDALASWFSLALADQDFAGFSNWRALAADAMDGHPNGAAKNGIRPAIDALIAAVRAEEGASYRCDFECRECDSADGSVAEAKLAALREALDSVVFDVNDRTPYHWRDQMLAAFDAALAATPAEDPDVPAMRAEIARYSSVPSEEFTTLEQFSTELAATPAEEERT